MPLTKDEKHTEIIERLDSIESTLKLDFLGSKDEVGIYEDQRTFKDFMGSVKTGMRFIAGAILLIGIDRLFTLTSIEFNMDY